MPLDINKRMSRLEAGIEAGVEHASDCMNREVEIPVIKYKVAMKWIAWITSPLLGFTILIIIAVGTINAYQPIDPGINNGVMTDLEVINVSNSKRQNESTNPTILSLPEKGNFRYPAEGDFHNPSKFRSAMVRSRIENGVSVTKSETPQVIMGSSVGYTYNVTIPEGDDLFHLHLFDSGVVGGGGSQFGVRIRVIWEDIAFLGNANANLPTPVGPTVLIQNHGPISTGPNLSNAVRVRTPGINSNDLAIYHFKDGIMMIDIQTADTNDVYFSVVLSF